MAVLTAYPPDSNFGIVSVQLPVRFVEKYALRYPWWTMLLGLAVALLLIQLAANAALAWYAVHLTRERSPAPSELVARMTDLEQEFVAMADSQARFLKRVSKRDRDESRRLAQEDHGQPDITPSRPKEQLRQRLAQLRASGTEHRGSQA